MTQKTKQEVIDFLKSDAYQIEQVFVENEKLAEKLLSFFYEQQPETEKQD